jgi:hypothetical protein
MKFLGDYDFKRDHPFATLPKDNFLLSIFAPKGKKGILTTNKNDESKEA